MKSKTGILIGFASGLIGFLLFFKVIFLKKISPSDELAPGVVVIASILNGFVFAFAGYSIQRRFGKREAKVE